MSSPGTESVETHAPPPEIDGEVRRDSVSRQLYSTDASIYEVHPKWVLIPFHTGDVRRIVEWALENGVTLVPRGGGTSLSGQSIGEGAIVDFSKHLDQILDWNPEQRTVRIEPGVVLDELNQQLREKHGAVFGPDVATSSRANIGGMIGNNSAGAHSIRFGHTSEHVASLRCLLSNGEEVEFRPVPREKARDIARGDGLEAQLYREIPPLIEQHADEIRRRYPETRRNSSGYGLNRFLDRLDEGVVDFSELICGSEGTLATVLEATLQTVPSPEHTGLLVLHCNSVLEAMKANQRMVPEDPYALELVDDMVLKLARESGEISRMLEWVEGEPDALLIVEATGESHGDLKRRLNQLESTLRGEGFSGAIVRALEPEQQEKVWKVRKAGLPLLMGLPGNRKPTAFVEDTVVKPERLYEYVKRFQKLVADHGTRAAFFGHSSVGCLHIRPLINLKSGDDVRKMRELAEDAVELVMEFNGAISGEHGVGRARSEWLEKMYGPTVVKLFRRVKRTFDPDGMFNPGNVVDPQPMNENLRYGPDYETRPFDTVQDFSAQGGFTELVELCNGNAACRKKTNGTMCPSYMVTREEEHSTRGRANALRGLLDGDLDREALTDGRLEDVMDLCISCKACKSECPSNVDMAPLKEEVMHQIHQSRGASPRDRFFAGVGPMARTAAPLAPVAHLLGKVPGVKPLAKRLLGVASQRNLPALSPRPFPFDQYPDTLNGQSNPVVLYVDTFNGYMDPDIARSACSVLQRLGYDPIVPRTACCGRPMMSKGFLERAQEQVRKNVRRLSPFAREQIPIVGLEPSCVSVLTDDIRRYAPGSDAEAIAEQATLFSDFVESGWAHHSPPDLEPTEDPLLLHGHCHQKALLGTSSLESLMNRSSTGPVHLIDSGCCGMAGSFGFEEEHFEHSRAMADRRLIPAVEEAAEGTRIVAEGTSCRQQIEELSGREAVHPAVLLDRLTEGSGDVDPEN